MIEKLGIWTAYRGPQSEGTHIDVWPSLAGLRSSSLSLSLLPSHSESSIKKAEDYFEANQDIAVAPFYASLSNYEKVRKGEKDCRDTELTPSHTTISCLRIWSLTSRKKRTASIQTMLKNYLIIFSRNVSLRKCSLPMTFFVDDLSLLLPWIRQMLTRLENCAIGAEQWSNSIIKT
jgi:hypothetical protein